MPPGFVNAICAPSDTVYASWASAMTSPIGLSPEEPPKFTMSAVIWPTMRLARGAIATRYLFEQDLRLGVDQSRIAQEVAGGVPCPGSVGQPDAVLDDDVLRRHAGERSRPPVEREADAR